MCGANRRFHMQNRLEKPLVSRDGKGNIGIDFVVQGEPRKYYWIGENEVNTQKKLIAMLRHLADKEQVMVPRHFAELIDVAHEIMGLDPYTGTAR